MVERSGFSFELAQKSKGIVPACKYRGQNKSVLPHLLPLCAATISFPFDGHQ